MADSRDPIGFAAAPPLAGGNKKDRGSQWNHGPVTGFDPASTSGSIRASDGRLQTAGPLETTPEVAIR